VANRMRERGFLLSTDGPWHNVLKLKPPLCIGKEDVDRLIDSLDHVLREDYLRSAE
jgi:4-aminobutyrate aminotransferase-like enzyme